MDEVIKMTHIPHKSCGEKTIPSNPYIPTCYLNSAELDKDNSLTDIEKSLIKACNSYELQIIKKILNSEHKINPNMIFNGKNIICHLSPLLY